MYLANNVNERWITNIFWRCLNSNSVRIVPLHARKVNKCFDITSVYKSHLRPN